jgi:hypothetical protein
MNKQLFFFIHSTQAEEMVWLTTIAVMAEFQRNDISLNQTIQLCSESKDLKRQWE